MIKFDEYIAVQNKEFDEIKCKHILKHLPSEDYESLDRILLGLKMGLPIVNYPRDFARLALYANKEYTMNAMVRLCGIYGVGKQFAEGINKALETEEQEQ